MTLAIEKSHSPCGASSMEKRAGCPGSLAAEKGLPDKKSYDADVGTLLHSVCEKVLDREIKKDEETGLTGIPEYDALDGREQYAVNFCKRIHDEALTYFTGKPQIVREKEVDMSFVHEAIGKTTPDEVLVEPFIRAEVIDFKFGMVPVTPADENLQLATLALGISHEYEVDEVRVTIAQPFINRVTHHTYVKTDFPVIYKTLLQIVTKALEPNAPRIPGDKQCRYCKAAGHCPEALGKATQLPVVTDPSQLAPSQISDWLNKWQFVKQVGNALEAHAYARLAAGAEIPGWKLGEGRKSRDWKEGAAETVLKTVAEQIGKDPKEIYSEPEVLSVAQLEKKWGKSKKVTEALKPLIEVKPGNLRLEKVGE